MSSIALGYYFYIQKITCRSRLQKQHNQTISKNSLLICLLQLCYMRCGTCPPPTPPIKVSNLKNFSR